MAIPQRLVQKLQQNLGIEAAEDLMEWIQEVQALRADVNGLRTDVSQLRTDVGQLRTDVNDIRAGLGEVKLDMTGLRQEMQVFRLEFRAEFAEFRTDIKDALHAMDAKVGDVKSDLMKWSFVFWTGSVLAIAALAGVLR